MAIKAIANLFATDLDKERDGVVCRYGNIWVKLARAGGANDKFQKLVAEKTLPFKRMIMHELLPEDIGEDILFSSFAEGIVRDWGEYKRGDDHKETLVPGIGGVAYSIEEVVSAFRDQPEFFRWVKEEAERLSNFRKAALESESGN